MKKLLAILPLLLAGCAQPQPTAPTKTIGMPNPAYWAANGHQRQINSDIFKFITSVWGILVHAVGKKAPSGATGKNSLIME